MRPAPKYSTVILDVDSTVSGIEGIDWLAERRGPAVAARIASLTDDAMRGVIPLESVYGARLAEIKPVRADIDALSRVYIAKLAPGCFDAVKLLDDAGVRVILISGGLRQAIEPVARLLGIAAGDVNAVDIRFDADGNYAGFDQTSPLATSSGKRTVIEGLTLTKPVLAMGDGATDVVMREVVDCFAAFVGFARRENVVAKADVVVESFAELAAIVLPS
jgi:phosphoserine phosphatase